MNPLKVFSVLGLFFGYAALIVWLAYCAVEGVQVSEWFHSAFLAVAIYQAFVACAWPLGYFD